MKTLHIKNDEKEMKALMGFEPAHNGKKRMDELMVAIVPTELFILTNK